ncbi:hypothetical protein GJ496_009944 [Pomphorhynchus laevis]|nr:hypothetical protein GJ496_009944 [Pomphorhynchus laevis]
MLSDKLRRRKTYNSRTDCKCISRWSSADLTNWSWKLMSPLFDVNLLDNKQVSVGDERLITDYKYARSSVPSNLSNIQSSDTSRKFSFQATLNISNLQNRKTSFQQQKQYPSSYAVQNISSKLSKCASTAQCNAPSLLTAPSTASYVPIHFSNLNDTSCSRATLTNDRFPLNLFKNGQIKCNSFHSDERLIYNTLYKDSKLTVIPEETNRSIISLLHQHPSLKGSNKFNKDPAMIPMVPLHVDGFMVESSDSSAIHSDVETTAANFDQNKTRYPKIHYRFEHVNICDYYRQHFVGKEHCNFIFLDSLVGLAILSLKREANGLAYRSIFRTDVSSKYAIFDCTNCTDVNPATLCVAIARQLDTRLSKFDVESVSYLNCLDTSDQILSYDERIESKTFKFGVILQREGQITEEQILHNTEHSEQFDTFLETIADRVNLKDFTHYRGGLDTSGNAESYYTTFKGKEIMFHVCTMLPLTPGDHQQLQRKRHIGNDIVMVVFQDCDSVTFSPDMLQSNFIHCIIVVQPKVKCILGKNTKETEYKVSVLRRNDVPAFGPSIPSENVSLDNLRNFLLTKLIHAEYACYRANKFSTLQTRTRQSLLQSLIGQIRPDIDTTEYYSSKSPKLFQYAITMKDSVQHLAFVGHVRKAINRRINNFLTVNPGRTKSLPSKFPIELKIINEDQLKQIIQCEQKFITTDPISMSKETSISETDSLPKTTEDILRVSSYSKDQSDNRKGRISADSLNDEGVDLDFPYSKDSGSESPDRIRSSFNSVACSTFNNSDYKKAQMLRKQNKIPREHEV